MKLDYSNTTKAITIFEEVIAESPDFPLPYLDINQGYTYMGTMGIIPAFEGFKKAQPFIEKAIQLKEDLPETQLNLAWISFWQNWDSEKAYQHLNRALSLKATDPMYLTMANFLTIEGKLDLAAKYVEKALELAPFSSVNINYKGFLHYLSGRYSEALPFFKRSLNIQPELPFPVVNIGACHLLLGDSEEALAYFSNLPDDNTGFLAKLGGITITHAVIGNKTKAYQGITELESYLNTSSVGNAINFLILAHAQLNNFKTAIDYIKMGIDNQFPLVLLLPTEPLASPLHDLPEFKKLIAGILDTSKHLEPNKKESYYKKELFTAQEIELYKSRLKELMENENLYLNPELTLRSLANYMNLSPNHMSQLLNKGINKNFSDFLNTYRLENFKLKLKNSNAHKLTILALAYDSGFNSKTVFNTFFKKKMGMTPKAYLKQISSDL
ncbi:MAG: helix-turn-helix domain-containing protein [Crocinitomicaceae bacterium]|nr:helix-turn-helix domain-containing protein [Crocinitomicaceae bacterium]